MQIKRGTQVRMIESGRLGTVIADVSYRYDRPSYMIELDGLRSDFWPYEFEVVAK